ncbi:alcohol dehydrogenase catalytic domain-containing protein [Streptosporangiaceae bacterium NEAU-GS5]|nr:alcohol dehydrogenase catalytic domain-containing protein [Streptosporangiaceae bacterium NEAU-GS5]
MRAAVYYGPGDVRVESRPVPEPGDGAVLIRVTRAGICGTDASEYARGPGMIPLRERHPHSGHLGPMILGHEFAGEVVAVGPGTPDLTGTRVACGAGVSCGRCRWCAKGRTNLCARYWTLGLNADGGLAEYVAAPAATCVPIPAGCGDDAAGLAQPLAVGLHAVRRASPGPDDVVVLIGAGAIGSFILCGLRARPPARVVAVDVDDGRLATARALGATDTLNTRDVPVVDAVLALIGPEGADVVIEATGVAGGAQNALLMAARGGRILQVGLPHGAQPLELAQATLREVDLATTVAHVCADDLPEALRLLEGDGPAGLILDRVIGLDDLVSDGLEALLHGRASGKILVDPAR